MDTDFGTEAPVLPETKTKEMGVWLVIYDTEAGLKIEEAEDKTTASVKVNEIGMDRIVAVYRNARRHELRTQIKL